MSLSLLSAVLTSITFPPFSLSFVILVALCPLLLYWEKLPLDSGLKPYFFSGWLFGFIQLAIFHRWMWTLGQWVAWPWAISVWLLFSAYLGLFYGLSCFVYGSIRQRNGWDILLFPACIVLGEWLRSLGAFGNPAASLGYGTANLPLVLASASYFGFFGLSFLISLINILLFKSVKRYSYQAMPIIVVVLALFLQSPLSDVSSLQKATLLQGNHEQKIKLDTHNFRAIRRDYLDMMHQAANTFPVPDLILMPETLTPSLNLENHNFLSSIQTLSKQSGSSILFGTPQRGHKAFYNAVALINPWNVEPQTVHKVKLMPFGEYWPLKSLFSKLGLSDWTTGTDYSKGKEVVPFKLPHPIGALICLESVYPWAARTLAQEGAELLYVVANNAWFFDSIAAEQHFLMSRFRAAENRRYLIQVTNTGISGLIGPFGQVIEKSTLNTREIMSVHFSYLNDKTLSMKIGEWTIGLSLFLLLLGIFLRLKPKY